MEVNDDNTITLGEQKDDINIIILIPKMETMIPGSKRVLR